MSYTTVTPQDIIKLALKDCGAIGIGQTPAAEDMNDAFTRLNWMISQWAVRRWLVYCLQDLALTSTGVQYYTVGPGGNFNTPGQRPDRLEAAFFRQNSSSQSVGGDFNSDFNNDFLIGQQILPSNPVLAPGAYGRAIDYPLQLIQSYEEYSRIALKQLVSFPSYCFYKSDIPLGLVYFWPVAQASLYEMHILAKTVLQQFPNLTTPINLPPEYYAALHFNLTYRLCQSYQLPVDPDLRLMAKQSLQVIRGANTQIGQLAMPVDLIRPGVYNPYSDQIR